MLSRFTLFTAITLTVAPALAQVNQPVTNSQISPNTSADSGPAAARNPNAPGATGDTKVPGDPSTIAGNKRATIEQRTGQGSSSNGGAN